MKYLFMASISLLRMSWRSEALRTQKLLHC